MHATEVHNQKRYDIADLPQEIVAIIQRKKCANCKQHFDITQNYGIEFAKNDRTLAWWHEPKRIYKNGRHVQKQCPQILQK